MNYMGLNIHLISGVLHIHFCWHVVNPAQPADMRAAVCAGTVLLRNTATSDYSMKVVIHRSICTVLWFIFFIIILITKSLRVLQRKGELGENTARKCVRV